VSDCVGIGRFPNAAAERHFRAFHPILLPRPRRELLQAACEAGGRPVIFQPIMQ